MKEIIINSTEDKNIIILAENGKLLEKYEEYEDIKRLEGNIYLGKITDILPGMQAAFVDIGDSKNAFLHLKDVLPKVSNTTGNREEDLSKYNIKDYVKVGMPIIVEVKRDKTGKKGAKVSTNLNIAGKFVAIIPNAEFITVSQKIEDKDEINRLSKTVSELNVKNFGIVIRTSAVNATESQLKQEIENLISIYNCIKVNAEKIQRTEEFKPTLLYEKGNIIKRLLLDIGQQGLDNIIVNNKEIFNSVNDLIKQFDLNVNVKLLDKNNLLDLYDLNKQLAKVKNQKVWLDCGGFIIIEHTEALTAIDVNTGKFIGKEDMEKTVLKVNSEATVEIAKQIRARDIGGIIIIDYIDMDSKDDENTIENLLLECLKNDRAKTQVEGFTKLHLLEMTRKHIFS